MKLLAVFVYPGVYFSVIRFAASLGLSLDLNNEPSNAPSSAAAPG
jgi:hypothetical protein